MVSNCGWKLSKVTMLSGPVSLGQEVELSRSSVPRPRHTLRLAFSPRLLQRLPDLETTKARLSLLYLPHPDTTPKPHDILSRSFCFGGSVRSHAASHTPPLRRAPRHAPP